MCSSDLAGGGDYGGGSADAGGGGDYGGSGTDLGGGDWNDSLGNTGAGSSDVSGSDLGGDWGDSPATGGDTLGADGTGGDWGDSPATGDNTLGADGTGGDWGNVLGAEAGVAHGDGADNSLFAQAGGNDIVAAAAHEPGTPTADGGQTVESRENYTWMGMSYEQTVRQTYDGGGNLVSTETVRPGSVWSDTTVVDNTGAGRTTYDAGGLGLAGQVSTSWDSEGRYTSVDGRAEAAFGVTGTDYSVNLGVQAGASVSYGDNGSVASSVNVGGDATVTHDPSGWGVRAGYEINGNASVNYDSNGQFQSFGASGSVDIPLSITQNGQEVAGVTLHPAQAGVEVTRTENGYDVGASAAVNVYPGVQVGGYAGGSYDTSTGGLDLGAGAHVNVFGQEIAGGDVRVWDQPGGGIGASGEVRTNIPDISQMPDIRLPDSFPNIPLPPMPSLPSQLPQFEWRPTNLPGNNGGSGGGWGS